MRNMTITGLMSLGLVAASGASTSAVTLPFTETFDTNASGWVNDDHGALIHHSSGGVDDSGYVSRTHQLTTPATPPPFGAPLELLFRANASNDASNDAFVGDWLASGVETFTFHVRHNASTLLDMYVRIAGTGGAGASVAPGVFPVAPGVWTAIEIPIVDSNPPFVSYGAGSFHSTFSNIVDIQLGVYVPDDFDASVTIDLDNVGIVPEPASLMVLGAGTLGLLFRRRTTRR